MSTVVDNRVVEMRFDNKQFETNVSTTMSTLDKLKQKLNLSGASKGLENVNSAAKNVNMNGLGSAVESVSMKFSALQVMGVTALANITNSAVNAGKRIVSALTIDPIKTGFQEYETQINAVQTILANTESKGTTLNDVNKALDTLNTYADKTIYNFTEMTRNIGTFTAAGVDLDTSVNAIQGIANLAAVSGSTSQQASTAMYQLSQALASGTVKLMDWNSVVNAGMGGEVFQNALKETARVHGVAIDSMIKEQGSFRETLSEGWLTSEILTETLQKFTLATEGLTDAEIEANRQMLKSKGYTDEQIESIFKLGNTATNAATKVKTFTQLWDVLKESAQSGWSQTWKLIIGDFDEAKNLLTPLADMLTGFINRMSDWRNNILRGALDFATPWTSIVDKLEGAGLNKIKKVADTVENVTDKLSHFQEVVDAVWRGDYFNSDTGRFELLESAGYDHRVVQDLVNKGNGYKLTIEDIEASHKKFGLTMEETSSAVEGASEVIATLSDEQLKNAGLTEDEIDLYRALEKEAARTGKSISELAKEMSENNGRDKLINSFKNLGSVFADTASIAKSAFAEIFDPPGTGELAIKLYGIIDSLESFTEKIRLTDAETGELTETAENLKRTFKGVFAVLDIVSTILGGGLKIAFNVLKEILAAFDMNVLEFTANVGDALVALRDWLLEGNALAKLFNGLIAKLPIVVSKIKDWFNAFKQTPAVQKLVDAINAIKDAFNKLTSGEINLSEFASSLGENLANALTSLPGIALQIGRDFIAGFQNGLGDSISGVIDSVVTFCLNFVNAFKEALGVQSPSWKAYETASDFFQGFINGARDMIDSVLSVLGSIGEEIVKVFKSFWDFITDESGNVEWGKIFAGGAIVSIVWFLKQIATAFSGLANALGGIDDLLVGAGKVLKSFSKVLNGIAWDFKAKALLKMAIAIGILVAAIWVLTTIEDPTKLWQAVGVIGVLAGILVALAFAMNALSKASVKFDKSGASIDGIKTGLLQIGIAILLVAAAVKMIAGLDPDAAVRGFEGLAAIAGGMIVFLIAMSSISKHAGANVSKVGSMMIKLSVALILMVAVCKLAAKLSAEEMLKGAAFATAFAIFVIAITKVAKSAGNNVSKVGGMILKITIAMALMVGVCKLVGKLSTEEMLKGAAFAAGFVIFVKALVSVTKIGKKQQLANLSGLVLSISFSLLLLVGVCKLVGKLSASEMLKGAAFVAGFVVLLKVLVGILKIGNEQQMAKVAGTILAMSAAIAILAGVAIILSFVPLDGLAKGIIAVGLLSTMMIFMVKSLKGAQNAKGAILMMAIAIGVMAGAVAALSFIPLGDLAGATAAMVALMGVFAIMVNSLKGLKKTPIAPLIVLTGVVLVLAGVIALLRNIDPLSAIGSAVALSTLMLAMTAVFAILNKVNVKIGNALLGVLALTALAVPLLAFVGVLALMQGVENATANALALTVLAGALTLMLIPLTLVGAFIGPALLGVLALTAMAIPMLAFVGVLALMNKVENATSNALLLMGLMTVMTDLLVKVALVAPLAVIGVAAMTGLTLLMGAIGVLAVAIGALMEKFPSIQNFLDTGLPVLEQLAGSIGTMIGNFIGGIGEGLGDSLVVIGEDIAAFMDTIATASESASEIESGSFDGVKELMDVMADIAATTVGTTIGDIFTLGGTSMEKFETDSAAFFGAMKKIGEASSDVDIDEESMNAIIGVAQSLADLQSSLEPIGGVMDWFTGRDDLGTFGTNAAAFISSMVTAFGSLAGSNKDSFNTKAMDAIIDAAGSLAELQSSLEPIGGVISWFTGKDDLGTFGTNAAAFISSMVTAFGSLTGLNQDAFNSKAMDAIIDAATSLASLQSSLEPIGGVVDWFTGRDDLGTFGENVAAFISSMVTAFGSLTGLNQDAFNAEAMGAIIDAATNLAGLQASLEPIGGVISWFTGRDDLGTFGTNAASFISSMKTAFADLGDFAINQEAVTSMITAAQSLADFQTTLEPMGGVVDWFAGRDDLGTFGTNLGLFADAMGKLKTGMGEDGISETVITSVTNAGNAIIALQEALPEEGLFDGKMNLTEFSDYVTDFGDAMSDFGTKAAEIDSGAVSTVISNAYRIKNLIASLVGIDTSGVEAFTGVGTGGIGADGAAYDIAQAISKYSDEVAGIDTQVVSTSVTAALRLKSLIASLAGLDASGIDNFKVESIGSQMKTYADKVAEIDSSAVSSSISSANRLKNFISSLADLDNSGIGKFNVGSIGTTLKTYGASVAGVNYEAVSSSISTATRLKNFISSLAGFDSSGVGSFKTAVDKLATVNISGLVEAFSGASTKLFSAAVDMMSGLIRGMQSKMSAVTSTTTKILTSINNQIKSKIPTFNRAGVSIVTKLAAGISSKKGAVSSALGSCLSRASSSIRSYYTSFYTSGQYLGYGLVLGINSKTTSAYYAGYRLGQAAVRGEKAGQASNSPSKLTIKAGKWLGEGLIIGIKKMGDKVYSAGSNMGNTAVSSISSAISGITDAINSDIDTQPTIRPVLDLSDVRSGVSTLGGMLNMGSSVGVMANVGAISSMMNSRIQNGGNDEVVSAINKLRKDLSDAGPSYNINGVTYDDGSNIADAVKTITRAAIRERRV